MRGGVGPRRSGAPPPPGCRSRFRLGSCRARACNAKAVRAGAEGVHRPCSWGGFGKQASSSDGHGVRRAAPRLTGCCLVVVRGGSPVRLSFAVLPCGCPPGLPRATSPCSCSVIFLRLSRAVVP